MILCFIKCFEIVKIMIYFIIFCKRYIKENNINMYSQRFLNVIPVILKHEGSLSDQKGDSGGITSMGVSLTFLRSIHKDLDGNGVVDALDIKSMTKEEAIDIYWNNFWKPIYESMPAGVGEKVFDVAVNAGPNEAHILLQKTLVSLGAKISIDGAIGNQTIQAMAVYDPSVIVHGYVAQQIAFYKAIVVKHPEDAKFLAGWINRSNYLGTV